jgi:hypothetical protein
MDAILATIDEGGRGIVVVYREGVNIFFSFIILILLKPFDDGLIQPLPCRLLGVG